MYKKMNGLRRNDDAIKNYCRKPKNKGRQKCIQFN
jgi:hypothetical protein